MLNGKAVSYEAGILQPTQGSVTVLDQNRDDIYDVVFIESYENYVVEEVILTSHRVTDKYGKSSLVFDPENKDVKFYITRGGQEIGLKDLKEWDVLSVAKSEDGSIVMVEVTTKNVVGKVEELHGDKFIIGGAEYGVSPNYPNEIGLNDEGTFYLDKDGNIAAVDATTGLSSNYAYLVAADITTGFDKHLQVKVLDKNGEIKVVKSGDKLKFNETSNVLAETVLASLKNGGANVSPQLVTFDTNAEGKLTRLATAKDGTVSGIDKTTFTLNADATLKYKESSKKLGNFNITKDTIVFDIPEGETDPTKYSVENNSLFENETDYDVLVYDVGEDLTAKVVVVTNSDGVANVEAPIAVVEKLSTTINSDNETVEKLYAFVDGKKQTFMTAEADVLVNGEGEKLSPGDIIQMKTNAAGEIESIRVLFEVENKGTEAKTEVSDDFVTVYGKVMKKFANSVNVSVNGGAVENYNIQGVRVYEFNSENTNNPIKVVEPGDIPQYDALDESRVFLSIFKDEVKEIVIVR